jgi:hypothetical protein
MKNLITMIFALLLSLPTFAQLDKASKQFLDSLGIKYDPTDPDAESKIEKAIRDKIAAKFDSATKAASNEVIDPENTELLLAEIADESKDEDTTYTSFEYMQESPLLNINLDHPDPRFLTNNGFELPVNLEVLFIRGNGKAIPVDLNALISKLSPERLSELYLICDLEGISEIPEDIGSLSNLRILALYGNKISKLPASIGKLTQLEALYIDGNPILELPETINGLKNLKKLGISGTQISVERKARLQKQLPNCKIL